MSKRVLILGAGFGGIAAYHALREVLFSHEAEVTIIDRHNYFVFTPLLHEVATGAVDPEHAIEPVSDFLVPGFGTFLHAGVKRIDMVAQEVTTTQGVFAYDYLLVALGSETNFYNIPGAKEHTLPLKDIDDARRIKNHLVSTLEQAARMNDTLLRKELLTFAMIGGGATGVELVVEIAEFAREAIKRYFRTILPSEVSVSLITKEKELLPMFHPRLRGDASELLAKKGIRLLLGRDVRRVTESAIFFSDGTNLLARQKFWAGGIVSQLPNIFPTTPLDKSLRLHTDEYLRVTGYHNVFAVGDAAVTLDREGKPLPSHAQMAVQAGAAAGRNVACSIYMKQLKPFQFRLKGHMISLGQWHALADIGPFHSHGPFAWVLWRLVYLANFHSWSKRLKIFFDWIVDVWRPRDISRL